MELTTDLFEQIVRGLGGGRGLEATAGAGSEKRRGDRLALTATVTIVPFGAAQATPRAVKLRSLSRSGAAILDWGTMQAGDKVVLHLPKGAGETIPVVCGVKNSRLCGGEFRIGMQFLSRAEQMGAPLLRAADGVAKRPVTEDPLAIIDAIADGRVHGTANRNERIELNLKALMSPYKDGKAGEMAWVLVKDISVGGGVCVVQPDEMKRDEQFILQLPRGQGKPLTMICTVVESRRMDEENFRVGARFETRLPDGSQLASIGFVGKIRRWFAA
jgi:hypothetical protein